MTSSDWLKMVALCLFRAQSESKINQFVTVLGQDHKVIDQHHFLISSSLASEISVCSLLSILWYNKD